MKILKKAVIKVIRWVIRQDRWEAAQSAERYQEWRARNIGRIPNTESADHH